MNRMMSNRFTDDMLSNWPTGTLHRMILVVDWAEKVTKDVHDLGIPRTVHRNVRHLRENGRGSNGQIRRALGEQLRLRRPPRETTNDVREIMMTPFRLSWPLILISSEFKLIVIILEKFTCSQFGTKTLIPFSYDIV